MAVKKAIKKAAAPRVGLPDCAATNLQRVVLGVGRFACNDIYVNLRDERGWPMRLTAEAHSTVYKRVRLVAEILEDGK